MHNMNSEPATATVPNRRGRWVLLGLFTLFFGSMVVAGALRLSGWQPQGLRSHGQMLSPPADLRALAPTLADGAVYSWEPAQRRWRILVAPGPECGATCVTLSHDLAKVWQVLGHNADNVDILWLGPAPAGLTVVDATRVLAPQPALRERLPEVDDPAGTPVYVVDPNGFVILRYAPGFDLAGLRADLAKLLKLK